MSVLLNLPARNKHEAIKKALLLAFSQSPAQKDAELLNIPGLVGRAPSTHLRRLELSNNNAESLRLAFF